MNNILIEKKTQLDFNLNTCPLLYTIQEFEENSRVLIIEITKNGELFDISEFSLIQIQLDKPDGTTVIEDSNGDYLSIENNNTIRILFGKHMADVSGFMVGKIMFFNGQSMIATTLFKIRIENGLTDSSSIITPDEYDSLVELLNEILEQAENIDALYDKVDDLEDDLDSEIERATNAENNISTDVGVDNFYTKTEINNMLNSFNVVEITGDLNNYNTSGFYKHSSTSTTINNSPTSNPFFLIVGQSNSSYQIVYDNNGDIYGRIKVDSTWTVWTLLNPRTVDDELDDASENPVQNKVIANEINDINESIADVIDNFSNYYNKNEIDALQNGFSVVEIASGSNLNNYVNYGFFCCNTSNANITNSPTSLPFFLIVGKANGYAYQILFDLNYNIYLRYQNANANSNSWKAWKCVTSTASSITIDTALNTVSKNPVENRVITERLNEIYTDLENDLQEVFQSVSNGKNLLASAITDKGIQTSGTDTFQTMSDNILQISSGTGKLKVLHFYNEGLVSGLVNVSIE